MSYAGKVTGGNDWQEKHRRYFKIAGITVMIEGDIDFNKVKFKDEIMAFAVNGSGDDNVIFTHHFEMPDLSGKDLGKEVYRKPPWAISNKNGTWFYRGISPTQGDKELHRVAVFNSDHTRANIFSSPKEKERILSGEWSSLSLFPTDQIWIGPLLADRNAVLLHAAAATVNNHGLVFVGHSDAGKSTTMEILKTASQIKNDQALAPDNPEFNAEILCDDRNIIRKWDDGWYVHGTWSHGTTADVSPSCAPLKAILFLEQSKNNKINLISDRKFILQRLLATLIRPMVTAEWWLKELDILERIVNEVPCYTMSFDKSGAIASEIAELVK